MDRPAPVLGRVPMFIGPSFRAAQEARVAPAPPGRCGGRADWRGWLGAPLQPRRALELRPPSPLGPSPQAPFSPLRGSAPHPVPGRVPLPAGGRADGILPVVIVRSHRVQDTVKRLPAERARSPPAGPLPDATEAEAVEAHGHAGCVAYGAQADGAPGICRCLRLPCLLPLPGDGRQRRAALLRSLFAARCHVLPRKTCKVPEL